MAEPARPRSSASITGMNSKSALSQRKRGSATAGIFEASSKFTTICVKLRQEIAHFVTKLRIPYGRIARFDRDMKPNDVPHLASLP